MTRSIAPEPPPGLWRQLAAILLLPTMTAGLVPALIALTGGTEIGWGLPGAAAAIPVLAGVAAFAAGARLVSSTIALLATEGRGTLAPWDPTRRLVVRGPYRRVRNPMITGVGLLQVGEAIALGSPGIGIWFGLFAIANAIYMPLVEEPGLVRRFGDDYRAYRRAVPRWVPRRTPWAGESETSGSVGGLG